MKRWWKALGLLGMVMAFAATTVSADGSARVRAYHNAPDVPPVDIWVDGEKVLENVPYGVASNYLPVPPGQRLVEVKVAPSSAEDAAALSTRVRAGGQPQTVAAIGSLAGDGAAPRLLELRDARGAWRNWSKLRVAHTSPDAPPVDVQVQIGKYWLPVIRNLAFGRTAGYLPLPAVNPWSGDPIAYNFRVTVAGTNEAVLSLPDTELPAGQALTLWAVGFVTPQGGSPSLGTAVTIDGM